MLGFLLLRTIAGHDAPTSFEAASKRLGHPEPIATNFTTANTTGTRNPFSVATFVEDPLPRRAEADGGFEEVGREKCNGSATAPQN